MKGEMERTLEEIIVSDVAENTMRDEIEVSPDFAQLDADAKNRVRQWALILVTAGYAARKELVVVSAVETYADLLARADLFVKTTADLIPDEAKSRSAAGSETSQQ